MGKFESGLQTIGFQEEWSVPQNSDELNVGWIQWRTKPQYRQDNQEHYQVGYYWEIKLQNKIEPKYIYKYNYKYIVFIVYKQKNVHQ